MRDMNPIKSTFAEQGVEFLAVNIFEEAEAAKTYIDGSGLDYDWLRAGDATVETLGIKGVPLLIVVDADGRVAWISGLFTPFRQGRDVQRVLERLTGQS